MRQFLPRPCFRLLRHYSTNGDTTEPFRFATASSTAASISQAVLDCVKQLNDVFDPTTRLDFCQLFVHLGRYGPTSVLAPKFLHDCLSTAGRQPPFIIGGVFKELVSCPDQWGDDSSAPGVSIMAAALPGVSVHGFHVVNPALPDLPGELWRQLVTGQDPAANSAAILIAEPHFVQVERFLTRLTNLCPKLPILGGVVESGAKGHYGSPGALFLGPNTFHEGAVGVVLNGPLQLDPFTVAGCTTFGPVATVTRSQKNNILELDGTGALGKLADMYSQLPDAHVGEDLYLAVDDTGRGNAFKTRHIVDTNQSQRSIQIAVDGVEEGTLIQLCVKNAQAAQQQLQQVVEDYAATVSDGATPGQPTASHVAALLYSCVLSPLKEEGSVVHSQLPNVSLQGAKCQGEFGPAATRCRAVLHAHTSVMGFLRKKQHLEETTQPAKNTSLEREQCGTQEVTEDTAVHEVISS